MQPVSPVETASPVEHASELTPRQMETDLQPCETDSVEAVQADVERTERPAGCSVADSSAFWLNRRDQITVAFLAIAAVSCLAIAAWTGRYTNGDRPVQTSAAAWYVDINSASEIELTVLKGVGPKLAARIIEERAANGPFQDVNDLQRVHGLGPRTIEKNRDRLRAVMPHRDPPCNDSAPPPA